MSFSYDPTVPLGQVRFLIGDTDPTAQSFSDEEITALLGSILTNGSLYLTAAACCDQLARRLMNADVKIGDYQQNNSSAAGQMLAMAERFREVENNLPAFAVAEVNVSQLTELEIIRNYVLRTLEG